MYINIYIITKDIIWLWFNWYSSITYNFKKLNQIIFIKYKKKNGGNWVATKKGN